MCVLWALKTHKGESRMQREESPVPAHSGSPSTTDWDVFELQIPNWFSLSCFNGLRLPPYYHHLNSSMTVSQHALIKLECGTGMLQSRWNHHRSAQSHCCDTSPSPPTPPLPADVGSHARSFSHSVAEPQTQSPIMYDVSLTPEPGMLVSWFGGWDDLLFRSLDP